MNSKYVPFAALVLSALAQFVTSCTGTSVPQQQNTDRTKDTFHGTLMVWKDETLNVETIITKQADGKLVGEYKAESNTKWPIGASGSLTQQVHVGHEVVFRVHNENGNSTLHVTFDKNFNEFKGFWSREDAQYFYMPWNGTRANSIANWTGVKVYEAPAGPIGPWYMQEHMGDFARQEAEAQAKFQYEHMDHSATWVPHN